MRLPSIKQNLCLVLISILDVIRKSVIFEITPQPRTSTKAIIYTDSLKLLRRNLRKVPSSLDELVSLTGGSWNESHRLVSY